MAVPKTPLPDVLKKYEGIDDRTILILTAEKVDEHLADHKDTKRRMWSITALVIAAFATSIIELIISHL